MEVNTIDEMKHFVCALFNTKPKEKTTVTARAIKKLFEKDEEKVVRKAGKLFRQVSGAVCPDDSMPLAFEEINNFRRIWGMFNQEVNNILLRPDLTEISKGLLVTERVVTLIRDWNFLLETLDGWFLNGYGVIHALKLRITGTDVFLAFLDKLRKIKHVPKEIQGLQDEHLQRFIGAGTKLREAIVIVRRNNAAKQR